MNPNARLLLAPAIALAIASSAAAVAQDIRPAAPAARDLRGLPPADPAAPVRASLSPELAIWDELVVDEVAHGEVWTRGRAHKAGITAAGLRFLPFLGVEHALAPLDLRLTAVAVGTAKVPLAAPTVRRLGTRITLDHGGVQEHFDLGADGIEQSWTIAALPLRGELRLHLAATTDLDARQDGHGGLVFAHASGRGVAYGRPRAFDAAGLALDLEAEWRGDGIEITVPAAFVAAAKLPLVVDPLLTTWGQPGPIVSTPSGAPDIAFDPAHNEYVAVWQTQFASNDWDANLRRLNRSMLPAAGGVSIDITGDSWQGVRVAGLHGQGTFLVTAQTTTPTGPLSATTAIRGRTCSYPGTVGSVITIDGTDGCRSADVGGDPWPGLASFAVVWLRGDFVYLRLVDDGGSLGPVRNVATSGVQNRPAISKSNHAGSWLVVYETAGAATDIRGQLVAYNGTLTGAAFPIANTAALEVEPEVSSRTDRGDYLVVWRNAATSFFSDDAIEMALVDSTGVRGSASLTALEGGAPPASWPILMPGPVVDYDGARFTVAYELYQGSPTFPAPAHDVYASCVAWLGATSSLRLDESRVFVGQMSESNRTPRVASAWSGMNATTPLATESGIVLAHSTLFGSGIQSYGYLGYANGGFTTFPSACGVPTTITATGTPALGHPVTVTIGTTHPFAGVILGQPSVIQLTGICDGCRLGVNGEILLGNPFSGVVPTDAALVGVTVSLQGFHAAAGPCFGTISLTNTLDVRVQ